MVIFKESVLSYHSQVKSLNNNKVNGANFYKESGAVNIFIRGETLVTMAGTSAVLNALHLSFL